MNILTLIVVLVVIGVLVWAFERYVPVAQPFKGIAIFLIILFGCWLVLRTAGVGWLLKP